MPAHRLVFSSDKASSFAINSALSARSSSASVPCAGAGIISSSEKYCVIVSEKDRGNDSNKNNRLKLLAMFGSEDGKQLARTEQVWDITSDRNNIVERAVHDIRYKLESN